MRRNCELDTLQVVCRLLVQESGLPPTCQCYTHAGQPVNIVARFLRKADWSNLNYFEEKISESKHLKLVGELVTYLCESSRYSTLQFGNGNVVICKIAVARMYLYRRFINLKDTFS